jgi:hypothetical protein
MTTTCWVPIVFVLPFIPPCSHGFRPFCFVVERCWSKKKKTSGVWHEALQPGASSSTTLATAATQNNKKTLKQAEVPAEPTQGTAAVP